jgi:hypothetical protein
MWIISTILEGGDIEEAIIKAIAMNAKRPSHLPPQGFLLSMLARISQAQPEVQGAAVDITVVKGRQTS